MNWLTQKKFKITDGVLTAGQDSAGRYALQGEMILPNDITRIGSYTFSGCSLLTAITIPSNVVFIGDQAYTFRGCTSLASVTFEKKSGWFTSACDYDTSGTNRDVSDATANATLLKEPYTRVWHQSAGN